VEEEEDLEVEVEAKEEVEEEVEQDYRCCHNYLNLEIQKWWYCQNIQSKPLMQMRYRYHQTKIHILKCHNQKQKWHSKS